MGCGQELERSSSNWKIGGSIPDSSTPHVDVSLDKTHNPKLLPLLCQRCVDVNEWLDSPDEQVGALRGSSCHQCMNVCERVNDMWCKALWVVTKTRKKLYKYSPFTIYHMIDQNFANLTHSLEELHVRPFETGLIKVLGLNLCHMVQYQLDACQLV